MGVRALRTHYDRKFDWDQARERYEAGEKIARIARDLGVSDTAVRRVVVLGERERMADTLRRWDRSQRFRRMAL